MAFKIIFLEEFGKAFVPKRVIPNLRRYALKSGYEEVPYKFFGMLFYISAAITGLIFIILIYPYLKRFSLLEVYAYSFVGWFMIQLSFAFLFILLVYFYLDLKIYVRTRKIEEQLPDFLQVLSSNLRGGMTFERALWFSIKPRFGILGSEMAIASKKVMTGYDVSKALIELSEKYDSLMLKRTVDLVISELESGGNVAELLDRIVYNLKEVRALKNELSASSIAYVIFISVIVIVISPLLFALSLQLIMLILGFIGKLSIGTSTTSLPFSFSGASVNPEDFRKFSIIAILVISFFSSLIVAIVEKGEIRAGIKYVPIYIIGSISLYFFFVKIMGTLFSGIV
ncbi:type II secretion system F family protein [Candidatus Woesearchaeota archaeon]|nr:type II secretion system F family protein [Candidatus Woesearchaeota archaeon]